MATQVFQTEGQVGTRDKTGVISFTIPYYVNEIDGVLTAGKGRGPLGLRETSRTWSEAENTAVGFIVQVTYEGKAEGDEGDVDYQFDSSFAEEPLESHPDYLKIKQYYEGTEDEEGKVKFPSTLKDNKKAGLKSKDGKTKKNPAFGLETYLSFRTVFRKTYSETQMPRNLIASVGTIAESLPAGYPTPPDRNWLVMPPKVNQRGNVFQITEEWMLSQKGGWPEKIYNLLQI